MSVPPNETGYQGQTVRPEIQAAIERIDGWLRDPIYVENNNLCNRTEREEGKQRFLFRFEGQLNEVERTTVETGWTGAGWTSAVCVNHPIDPRGTVAHREWSLRIAFEGA